MKRSVLFVDDDPNVLQGLRRMLRPMRREWEMAFADGGPQALEILASGAFDVIVSDMRMPGMDGAELLARVKRDHPEVVRIVLSGHSERESIMRSIDTAHQYLAKPCDADVLKRVIGRACRLRDLLRTESLRSLVSRLNTIPSLPQTYSAIVEELQSPDASIQSVGRIIARDVGMTAKVLQLVNSAFFGLRCHVSDPAQAASLLGVDTLKALVLSVHIFSQLDCARVKGLCIEMLWNHSMAVGALAKRIAAAEKLPRESCDHALLAGLVHDAGKLVLAANLPAEYALVLSSAQEQQATLEHAERAVFDTSHGEVGAYLLGLWGLPDPIVEAVAFHHHPGTSPVAEFTPLTAVHVANALASAVRPCCAECLAEPDQAYLQTLGVADRWEDWREITDELMAEGVSQ